MKTFATICISSAITILLLGIFDFKPLQRDCDQYKETIDSLINCNLKLQSEKELVMWDLELLMEHYCASENLFDTIFINFVTNGTFVFEYEPYSDISNEIFENEELYELLEEKRKLWDQE